MTENAIKKGTEEWHRLTPTQKEKVGKAIVDLRIMLDEFTLEEVLGVLREFEYGMIESFKFHSYYFPHRK